MPSVRSVRAGPTSACVGSARPSASVATQVSAKVSHLDSAAAVHASQTVTAAERSDRGHFAKLGEGRKRTRAG